MIAPSSATDWQAINQRRLARAIADLKSALQRHADRDLAPDGAPEARYDRPASPATDDGDGDGDGPPSALDALCAAFNLSPFERGIVVLCAAVELDSAVAPLCAAAQGDAARPYPTFSLALAALPDAHWSAITPDAPLRRWRLIDLGAGTAMTLAPLRIDERVLHHLAGVSQIDERLAGLVEPVAPAAEAGLAPAHAAVARGIAAAWSAARGRHAVPAIHLCAADPADARPVAAAAAAALGLRALALPADLIPAAAAELDALVRLWEREAVLGGAVLLVESDPDAPSLSSAGDDARARAAGRLVERVDGPVIVSAREPIRIAHRTAVRFDLVRPSAPEQRAAWHAALGACDDAADRAAIDAIASQFSLSFPAIRAVAAEALAQTAAAAATAPDRADVAAIAWQSCRQCCRTRLDGLAQRIDPVATWDDLVLPDPQLQMLRQVAVHVRHRATVYDTWGFAAKSARGLGISALFAGPSGTGKTMAAEVLAADLKLDLYRIDLASMVSKYIGETEKNLRKVFDAAEDGGAILLFDEADALFGKRSEVKDSHDRYANIEVSYLLQRIEAYRGLAVLTTNLRAAVDQAFLRRLRFVVEFPFPDAAQRAEMWRNMFHEDTPTEGLDPARLARLNVTGGSIRNIALHAAFQAAEAGQPVRMTHLRAAAKSEHAKLERTLTEAELGGWT